MNLRQAIAAAVGQTPAWASDAHEGVSLSALASRTWLPPSFDPTGRTVLVHVGRQLAAAIALVDLDGRARRIVLCPPDFDPAHLDTVCAEACVDTVLHDGPAPDGAPPDAACVALVEPADALPVPATRTTEWLMFTSGTSGPPKMVAHTLAGLTGAIKPAAPSAAPTVWGTFYDIRRYGGLQVLLRALLGGSSLVLSDAHEPVADFLQRLARAGVTNLSGTPSHWRRALMSPAIAAIAPRYVRLSGEIADQAVLDALKAAFPHAAIGHAYASTEAGVGFEVTDGREGFPAAMVGRPGEVELKVADDTLFVRSPRAAAAYVGTAKALADVEGFVDTGDMVQRRGDRYLFAGRRGGIINVGGLKVHPEEVEAVINRQPGVRMSRVYARKSPITGALVVAEVAPDRALDPPEGVALKQAILDACRAALPPAKAPAMVTLVQSLALTPGGKLERRGA